MPNALEHKKAGDSDALVGELYGGSRMVCLLEFLFGMRSLSIGSGEMAVLLIRGAPRELHITECYTGKVNGA